MSKDRESLQTPAAGADTIEPPAQLAMLKRAAIVRSKTNPRTHFDADYLKDLGASIQAHGILQPILVRPLPGARVQETAEERAPGAPLPTHEIVCGECRWRASELAGVDDIPVLIRTLTDLQVLQVQLVENLKRKDLHPLEEAEGFERLMKDHGLTVEDIAAKVDKSASQIYVTLKLLELTPECREELYAGKLTRSTALLVARAPAYLQTQIAKDIMRPTGEDQEPMSYRQAQRYIHQHYMLQLAHAVFDIKDASLVPKAGSCGTCAKNTGANSDMFEDVKGGDTCTDPKCFDAKKVAHYAAVTKDAAAKGQKVIQGKEAKELIAYEGATPEGYRLLDQRDYINGTYTTLRKLAGKDGPAAVLIVDPFTKLPVEALPSDVANKLIKKADTQKKANKEPRKADLEEEFKEAWQARAIEQLHAAVMAGKSSGITVPIARHIAQYYEQSLGAEAAERFARLFDIKDAKVGASNAIQNYLKTCADAMVGPALLVLMVEDDLAAYNGKFELADLIAGDAGIDLQDVQAQVKTDMLEAAAAKSPTPAAKPGKAKKTSAADAKAAISEALQAVPTEIKIGQRVRFKEGLKGPTGKARKVCGREGYVDHVQDESDPPSYGVRYGDKPSDYANARLDELIILPGTAADGPLKVKLAKGSKATKAGKSDDAAPFEVNGRTIDPAAAWPFPTAARA